MSGYSPEEHRNRQLEKLYGPETQRAKTATREEILTYQLGLGVEIPTPARIQWLITDQSDDVSFERDDSLPTEAQLREKQDDDLATLVEQVFEETGIENGGLLVKLAKMPADVYEVFMQDWLEVLEVFPRDFDWLIQVIDKNCVRADGTIRKVKLKRLIKTAKQEEMELKE